jgi:hypothetical protein
MAAVARVSTRLGGALYRAPASVTVSWGNTPRSFYTYSPEPAQPLKRDPKWVSAKEAVQCIKSGMEIIYINIVIKLSCDIETPIKQTRIRNRACRRIDRKPSFSVSTILTCLRRVFVLLTRS